MVRYFETKFLEEADRFVAELPLKATKKVFFNIEIAEKTNDPRLFKKLHNEIWEFRTLYAGHQIRLLAFWDKTEPTQTLVFATHGFMKKEQKTPVDEIARAERIRKKYFEYKNKK
jgi:phage-related protein